MAPTNIQQDPDFEKVCDPETDVTNVPTVNEMRLRKDQVRGSSDASDSKPVSQVPTSIMDNEYLVKGSSDDVDDANSAKVQIVWRNIGLFVFLHSGALYGLFLCLTGQVMWQTAVFGK